MAAVEFFYDPFSGTYDVALREAIKMEPVLSKIKWQDLSQFDGFKELVRQLQFHKAVVKAGVDGDAPPPLVSRTLKRYSSDEAPDRQDEIQRERADVWRQAQQTRRKFITKWPPLRMQGRFCMTWVAWVQLQGEAQDPCTVVSYVCFTLPACL